MSKTVNPLLLHLETATELCSVALSLGDTLLTLVESGGKQDHAANLVKYIQEALSSSGRTLGELDGIAVSAGPGSYTGLRVGASTAKAMCFALRLPLLAVGTMESLAWAARHTCWADALYIPMLDARRMEVYTAVFDQDLRRLTRDFPLVVMQSVFEPLLKAGEKLVLSGNGTHKCADMLSSKDITILQDVGCSARHMIPLALKRYRDKEHADLRYFTPTYVKAPNITSRRKALI